RASQPRLSTRDPPGRGPPRRPPREPPALLGSPWGRPAGQGKAAVRMIPAPVIAAGTAGLVRLLVGVVGLASITVGAVASGHEGPVAPARAPAGAPNVLLVIVDDQATN